MTDDKIAFSTLLEKSSDASFMREMIGYRPPPPAALKGAAPATAKPTQPPCN